MTLGSSGTLLGIDLGSSSVKTSLLDIETGQAVGAATSPSGTEMDMPSPKPGWAEQDPKMWWDHVVQACQELKTASPEAYAGVKAIGISYQMHGLVLVDQDHEVLRASIIWCDSRAVEIGNSAFEELGEERCLSTLLNSPGNFTASKLKWVKDNEPDIYSRIHKAMLPGDYIALKLTGEIRTTASGLSEGILWDFGNQEISRELTDYYGFDLDLFPEVVHTFDEQGQLSPGAAQELGLEAGVPIAYRAGDQPNNALSLNVLNPGEIAATAGTSGVVYGVTDQTSFDPESRVNTFVHVNHSPEHPRYGVLLCINGTGILNSWLRKFLGLKTEMSYPEMNEAAGQIPPNSNGVVVLPFGNGAERVLGNKNVDAQILGVQFNQHSPGHIIRAAQEGIVYSLNYGLEVMKQMGLSIELVRAGHANMFLSPIFREAFVNVSGANLELYNTDGSLGAARGAGLGSGFYKDSEEAFAGLKAIDQMEPKPELQRIYEDGYGHWKQVLQKTLTV